MTAIEWERFLAKVQIGDGCWIWTGARSEKGYGFLSVRRNGRRVSRGAHRLVLEFAVGRDLVTDEFACHRCDTPSCVRPDHLYVGTAKTNAEDCIRRGRKPVTLTVDLVRRARLARRQYGGLTRLARAEGVNLSTLRHAADGIDAWYDVDLHEAAQ